MACWHTAAGTVFQYVAPDGRLTLVDCQTGKECLTVGFTHAERPPPEKAIYLSPDWMQHGTSDETCIMDARPLAANDNRWEYVLWERATGERVRQFTLPPGDNLDADWWKQYSPDGRLLYVQHPKRGGRELLVFETATGCQRGRVHADVRIHSYAFSPDGKTLALSCADSTVLIMDLQRPLSGKPVLPAPRTAAECQQLWEQLGEKDAASAEQALWTLVRAPAQALPMLRERLQPVKAPAEEHLTALLRRLDSQSFAQREGASRELLALGVLARPALRTALTRTPTSEQRQRLEQQLRRLEDLSTSSAQLRAIRAVEVLERIGGAEARRLLEILTSGVPQALLTSEARLALLRLQRQQ